MKHPRHPFWWRHFELLGGDGGWIVFDPHDETHVYASFQRMGIYRFRAGGSKRMVLPLDPDERNSVWMCYITLDPNNPKTVFTGSYRVWRTKNDGDKWAAVSAALDGSAITAIEVASSRPAFSSSRQASSPSHPGRFSAGDSSSAIPSLPDLTPLRRRAVEHASVPLTLCCL